MTPQPDAGDEPQSDAELRADGLFHVGAWGHVRNGGGDFGIATTPRDPGLVLPSFDLPHQHLEGIADLFPPLLNLARAQHHGLRSPVQPMTSLRVPIRASAPESTAPLPDRMFCLRFVCARHHSNKEGYLEILTPRYISLRCHWLIPS